MPVKCKCEICEKEFFCRPGLVAAGKTPRYCGQKCMGIGKTTKVDVPCFTCKKVLKLRPSEIAEHNFCSHKCRGEWQKGQTGSLSPHYKGPIAVQCSFCGKTLERIPAKIKRAKYHFCDTSCHGNWRKTQTGSLSPRYDDGKIEIKCSYCNKEITKYRCRVVKHKFHFCDKKCSSEWRKTLTGESSNRYKGGYTGYYGPDWLKQSRAARKRDSYCCQACGKPQKINKRALDVHHVIPFRNFGYIPKQNENHVAANSIDNLVSLCQSCHGKLESGKLSLLPRHHREMALSCCTYSITPRIESLIATPAAERT